MKQSKAGFTGNSPGATGGASEADLERGYSTFRDDDDDTRTLNGFQRRFGPFGDYNPEPDVTIDRDTEKDWDAGPEINL